MRRLLATAMLCLLTVPVQAEGIEHVGSLTIVGKDGQRYSGQATFTVTPKTRKAARKLRGPVKVKPPHRNVSRACLHSSTKDVLNKLEARFGQVKLAKTCVPGARMPGGRPSWHASNRAFDFHVPKGARHGEVMVWLGQNSPGVTIGYGGRLAGIIHTDTGNFYKVIYRAASHEAGEKAVAIWQERARLAALAPVPQTQREADPPREPAPWSITTDYVEPSFDDYVVAPQPPPIWGRDIFRRYVESKDVVVQRHVKFSCPGGKPLPVGLTTMLQDAAAHWQTTVYVNSFYRSPAYNRKVGGARQSRHIRCEAVDWRVAGVAPATLRAWVVKHRAKWKVTGVGTYRSHIHADIGRTRLVEWNGSRKRYAKRKSRYASAG